jgi:hypothetical protein
MGKAVLELLIQAKDMASGVLKNVGNSIGSVSDQVSRFRTDGMDRLNDSFRSFTIGLGVAATAATVNPPKS